MTSAAAHTRSMGGIVRVRHLRESGFTESAIRRALAEGLLVRIRKGWVAVPDAPADFVRAVRLGGRVACITAAHHHGLWTMGDEHFHLALPAHAGRIHGDTNAAIMHWQSAAWGSGVPVVESVREAIRQVLLCRDRETSIAVIDSALNRRAITWSELRAIIARLPIRFASVLELVDGASESGLETLCRLRLMALGLRIRSQVAIDGVGRVDLVVGDRLVIEADGREWHAGPRSFLRDRTRDLALMRLGYIVLRVGYEHVLHEWQLVELAVLGIVGRGEHLWTSRHRRDGLAP